MNEIIFLIEEAPEGGYTARALSNDIFTQADTEKQLKEVIKDAVICHFDKENLSGVVLLHSAK
jgi:hypothetical protein